MDIWFFLLEMVMLLGGAFILGAIAQRLRQSPIIGYILAGTIVGPFLFNATTVNNAAELGVSMLLFSIGLEFSFKKLRQMGRMAFGGGTLQVTATIGIVTALLLPWFGLPQAITMGAIVSLSSTAVVLRLLVDHAAIESVRGRSALGILLLQDIAIVPLVIIVSLFAPAGTDANIGLHILKILAAFIGLSFIFYLLLYHLAPILLSSKALFANRELTVLLAISVGLGAAWSAHAVNISPALGAFIAGMLLGESPFAVQIRADIGTLRIVMVTLFFASTGMLLKPYWFITHLHWIMMVAILIFILKTGIVATVLRLFGLNARQALATGITLGQVGEFSFVLAATARQGAILDPDLTDLIFSVVIILMLLTPYMVTMAIPFTDRLIKLLSRKTGSTEAPQSYDGTVSVNQVLVVGLGPAGRQVVETFIKKKWKPVVIDVNPESRSYAQKTGIKFYLGDACQEDILQHAGLSESCMAVITVPDPGAAVRIIQMIRLLMPEINIAARCRYNRHVNDLKKAGADIVIDEEINMGQILSKKIIEIIGENSGSNIACRIAGQHVDPPNDI